MPRRRRQRPGQRASAFAYATERTHITRTHTHTHTHTHPTRPHSNGFDLNRNFPDPWTTKGDLRAPTGDTQPETRALMEFSLSRPFTASANMHEGAIVRGAPEKQLRGVTGGRFTAVACVHDVLQWRNTCTPPAGFPLPAQVSYHRRT